MKKLLYILIVLTFFSSCKSSKRATTTKKTTRTHKTTSKPVVASVKASKIIDYAKGFEGVRYKYGGTTRRGMDCSGLIYTSFGANKVDLPRVSSDMAKKGEWVDIKALKPGDLVFFATRKGSRKINHVGLVTKVHGNNFEFIHATTSKGVITSSIKERYWYLAYVQARRVI